MREKYEYMSAYVCVKSVTLSRLRGVVVPKASWLLPGQSTVIGLPLPMPVVRIQPAVFRARDLPFQVWASTVGVQRLVQTVEHPLPTRDAALLGIELKLVIKFCTVPIISSILIICKRPYSRKRRHKDLRIRTPFSAHRKVRTRRTNPCNDCIIYGDQLSRTYI